MSQPATAGVAVLALHYQNDVVHEDGKIRLGVAAGDPRRVALLDAAQRLLGGARAAGVPVVHVQICFRADGADIIQNCAIFRNVARIGAVVAGGWGADFHERLRPRADELVVQHRRVNAFYGSGLEEALRILGPTRLVVAGVATNSVVEHSCRHASDIGFAVSVAQDACSASRDDWHQVALDNIALIGEVSDVGSILAGWAGPP